MNGAQHKLVATGALVVGVGALVVGTVLAVTRALDIAGMGLLALHALWSWVPFLGPATKAPVPQYDFFAPTLLLLAGLLLVLVGWVAIVRGVTVLWPARYDRSPAEIVPAPAAPVSHTPSVDSDANGVGRVSGASTRESRSA